MSFFVLLNSVKRVQKSEVIQRKGSEIKVSASFSYP